MVSPWDWEESYLLLSVYFGSGTVVHVLVNRMSQEEVMEALIKKGGKGTVPTFYHSMSLTEEAYDVIAETILATGSGFILNGD